MEWTQRVLTVGEAFSGSECASLRTLLERQSGKFFRLYHHSNIEVHYWLCVHGDGSSRCIYGCRHRLQHAAAVSFAAASSAGCAKTTATLWLTACLMPAFLCPSPHRR